METITIGFSRPRSKLAIMANVIRLFEGCSAYSHVFISWKSVALQRELIYEARGNGVNFTNSLKFNEHNLITKSFDLKITPEIKTKIVQFCIDNARTDYGYLQILGIGIVRGAALLGITVSNPFKGGNICSELAARILVLIDPSISVDLDNTGPKKIYELVEKMSINN